MQRSISIGLVVCLLLVCSGDVSAAGFETKKRINMANALDAPEV